jgi:hypothetical protein
MTIIATRDGIDPITAQSYQHPVFAFKVEGDRRNLETEVNSRVTVVSFVLRLQVRRMNERDSDDYGRCRERHCPFNKLVSFHQSSPFSESRVISESCVLRTH